MLHKNIRLNPHTLLLEAVEAALKYEIDPSLEPSLKRYFQNSPYLLLSGWYKTLNEKEIEKVKCSSAYNQWFNYSPNRLNGPIFSYYCLLYSFITNLESETYILIFAKK